MDPLSQIVATRVADSNTKHSSIGKNGTFWLPPKSSDNFSSNLKRIRNQNQAKTHSSSKGSAAQQGSKSQIKATPNQSQQFSAKAIQQEVKVVNERVSNKSPISKMLSTSSNPKTMKANQLPRSNFDVNRPVLSNLSNNPVILKKKSENIESNFQSKEKDINYTIGDKEEGASQHKKGSHGTKDAQPSSCMQFSDNIESFVSRLLLIASSSGKSHGNSADILQHVAKEIAARIALLDKKNKKVIRMAIDLPNGVPLGVRIEKCDSSLSVSFISENHSTQESLNFLKKSFRGFCNSESPIKIHFFNSYNQMDGYFQQAA